METKKVPSSAFCLDAAFELTAGEDPKKSPVKIKALSGDAIAHPWWGKVVLDLSGMTHAQKIAIDYCHDPDEIMGYIDKFSVESNSLYLYGELVPKGDDDRAAEVLFKGKGGVPYQASVDFRPTSPNEIVVENIMEGSFAEVNGHSVSGPATVVRKWKLGAVAICPYGADSGTATIFNKPTGEIEINLTQVGEKHMEVKKEDQPDPRAEFRKFKKAFGDKAAKYFEAEMTFEAATEEYLKELKEENKQLAEKVETLSKKSPGFDPDKGVPRQKLSIPESKIKEITKNCGGNYEKVVAALSQEVA